MSIESRENSTNPNLLNNLEQTVELIKGIEGEAWYRNHFMATVVQYGGMLWQMAMWHFQHFTIRMMVKKRKRKKQRPRALN